MRKIVISTGGSDAPGLNAVIFAVVNAASKRGWEVYGSRQGYKGLLDLDDLIRLTPADVEGITPTGGTILGSTNKIFDHMVAWTPPIMSSVPLAEAIRSRKMVDLKSDKMLTARDIGICLWDE